VFCKGQLVELQRDLPLLQRAGLGLAAISYDSTAVLADFASRKGITFPLLSDHESVVIRAFGVADRKYRKGAEIDVDSSGFVPVYGLPYSAVFVLRPDGTVRWRFVSEHEELRLTGSSILERSVGATVNESRLPLEVGKLHVDAVASNTSAGLGSRLIIGLELRMPPGWHVYGPQVTAGYRGITWQMDSSECSIIGDVVYPKPHWRQMAFSGEKLPVYEGTLRLTRELIIKPILSDSDPSVFRLFCRSCLDSASKIHASGSLQFQACDQRECFPPQSIPLEWKFDFLAPDRQRAPVRLWRVFEQ
jgi:peroxiredoxin